MDTKRKQLSRYAAGLALLFSCVGSMQLFAQDPAPVAVTEEIELFNGKDLTNWYRFIKGRETCLFRRQRHTSRFRRRNGVHHDGKSLP